MFTGLVEEIGVVRRIERDTEGAKITVGARTVLDGSELGDSIAVSGACLTVTAMGSDELIADCMAETLERTTLGTLKRGAEVNLERSLALGQRLGGHLVLGHVDAVAQVKAVERRGEALEIRFSLPPEVAPFVAEKGSVALDGVSLTVMKAVEEEFVVGVIPHTIAATTLRSLSKGASVNVEADVIARYVHRSLTTMNSGDSDQLPEAEGLSMELLIEEGFA